MGTRFDFALRKRNLAAVNLHFCVRGSRSRENKQLKGRKRIYRNLQSTHYSISICSKVSISIHQFLLPILVHGWKLDRISTERLFTIYPNRRRHFPESHTGSISQNDAPRMVESATYQRIPEAIHRPSREFIGSSRVVFSLCIATVYFYLNSFNLTEWLFFSRSSSPLSPQLDEGAAREEEDEEQEEDEGFVKASLSVVLAPSLLDGKRMGFSRNWTV